MKNLPSKYKTGFLRDFDKRTELYQYLHAAFTEVTDDLGGADTLSHARRCLAERFVFLEFALQGIEKRIAEAQTAEELMELFGRWTSGLNALTGLGRTIGLDRRTKPVVNLRQYVKDAQRKERNHKESYR